jgi:hypothetical protein
MTRTLQGFQLGPRHVGGCGERMDIQQNTLYLTTHGSYVARDHLTLQVEVPVYPEDLPREERSRERASD